jgi:8-oxo-dGTP diphosphatase
MTAVPQPVLQVAEVLVRDGDDVLLVKQQKAGDPEPYWTLPGGLLEPGETPVEAVKRETFEEAGITLGEPLSFVYVSQLDRPGRDGQVIVYGFETRGWSGQIACEDPDSVVTEARFFPLREAVSRVEGASWSRGRRGLRMRAPLVAYLRGEVECGALWAYRELTDGSGELVGRVPGGSR